MSRPGLHFYQFDEFQLDIDNRCLLRGASAVPLSSKAFDLLLLFVEKPKELLERDYLLSQIWSDRHVGEANLSVTVSTLRKALGDSAGDSRYIETIPTKGYRFIAPVTQKSIPIEKVEEPVPEPGPSSRPSHSWMARARNPIVIALLLVAALGVLIYHMARPHTAGALLNTANIRPVTHSGGDFSQPAFSSDGQSLAYASAQGGPGFPTAIYTQKLNGESAVAITKGGLNFAPAWSPDGKIIAYLHCERVNEPMALVSTAADGTGQQHEIAQVAPFLALRTSPTGPPALDWSQDGKLLVTSDLHDGASARGLVLIAAETGKKSVLTRPSALADDSFGRFSPDGRFVAFRRKFAASAEDVFIVDRNSGAERRITWDRMTVCGVSWSEDGQSLVVCSLRGGGYGNLWRFYLDQRSPEQLGTARFGAKMPTVARRGSRLAYIHQITDDNIWSIPIHGGTPHKLIASTFLDSSAHYSPGGDRIAFRSNRTGDNEIWICNTNGEDPVKITHFDGPMVGSPRWSPDGRTIAFDSRVSGTSDIYTIDLKSKAVTRITATDADEEVPNWSHDGKWIYYGSNRTGRFELWKRSVSGDREVQVTTDGGFNGVESPDGRYLYYVNDLALTSVARMDLSNGRSETLIPALGTGMWAYWTLSGDSIFFLHRVPGKGAALNRLNLSSRMVQHVGSGAFSPAIDDKGLAVSPDGESLLFTNREYSRSVIMMAENFR